MGEGDSVEYMKLKTSVIFYVIKPEGMKTKTKFELPTQILGRKSRKHFV